MAADRKQWARVVHYGSRHERLWLAVMKQEFLLPTLRLSRSGKERVSCEFSDCGLIILSFTTSSVSY